jgi:hypothetical protein
MTTKTRKTEQASLEEMAALDFEPWHKGDHEMPTPEEINNPHLMYSRLAYAIMHKTKPELIKMFADSASYDDDPLFKLIENFPASVIFFKGAAELIDRAHTRLLIAGASYTEAE